MTVGSGENEGESEILWKSVDFQEEPIGISRILGNGIMEPSYSKQNPGVIGTVSIITTNTTQRTRPGHQIAIIGSFASGN